jgi:homogentisate phytyltransferase/homogentisate geranylgeranyltransferase
MPLGTLTRWKQFPLLAAMCIFSVRGVIVQIGFHEHMRMALPHRCVWAPFQHLMPRVSQVCKISTVAVACRSVLPWSESTTTVFAVCFFTMYGVAIALFKDVPDILGDEQAGVRTAAVVLGARRVSAVSIMSPIYR